MILIGKCSRGGCSTRTLNNNTPKTYKTKCRKGEMFCLSTGKCSQSCSPFPGYNGDTTGSQMKTIIKTKHWNTKPVYFFLTVWLF